jgi:hypothetical protein
LAALLSVVLATKWKYLVYPLGAFLIFVNLFQIGQYNSTVLHYYDMNRKYYANIFLDANPRPLVKSLLDTDVMLKSEEGYQSNILAQKTTEKSYMTDSNLNIILLDTSYSWPQAAETDISVQADIKTQSTGGCYLYTRAIEGQDTTYSEVRLFYPKVKHGAYNRYHFYTKIPSNTANGHLKVGLRMAGSSVADVKNVVVRSVAK